MARTKLNDLEFKNGVMDFLAKSRLSKGEIKFTAKGLADHLGVKEASAAIRYSKWKKDGAPLPDFDEKPRVNMKLTVAERNAAVEEALKALYARLADTSEEPTGLEAVVEMIEE